MSSMEACETCGRTNDADEYCPACVRVLGHHLAAETLHRAAGARRDLETPRGAGGES